MSYNPRSSFLALTWYNNLFRDPGDFQWSSFISQSLGAAEAFLGSAFLCGARFLHSFRVTSNASNLCSQYTCRDKSQGHR